MKGMVSQVRPKSCSTQNVPLEKRQKFYDHGPILAKDRSAFEIIGSTFEILCINLSQQQVQPTCAK